MRDDLRHKLSRRAFMGGTAGTLANVAAATMMGGDGLRTHGLTDHKPRAKRVIYLDMAGAPPQLDMFDYKPAMRKFHGEELPDSVRNGQRLTTMTSGQKSFPCVAPMFEFKRMGQHGTWVNETLPHIGSVADDITIIK